MFNSTALVFSFLQNPSSGLQRIHFLPLLLQCFALHFDLHKGSAQSTFHVSWYPSLTLLRKERMEPTAGNIVTLYSLRIQEAWFKSNTASYWNQGSLRRWTIKHSVSEFQQFSNHAGRHAFVEPAIRLKRNGLSRVQELQSQTLRSKRITVTAARVACFAPERRVNEGPVKPFKARSNGSIYIVPETLAPAVLRKWSILSAKKWMETSHHSGKQLFNFQKLL